MAEQKLEYRAHMNDDLSSLAVGLVRLESPRLLFSILRIKPGLFLASTDVPQVLRDALTHAVCHSLICWPDVNYARAHTYTHTKREEWQCSQFDRDTADDDAVKRLSSSQSNGTQTVHWRHLWRRRLVLSPVHPLAVSNARCL